MQRFVAVIFAGLLMLSPEFTRGDDITRVKDVVYARKFGMALTMDVLKPQKPNGIGVIFLVSGGFSSDMGMINPKFLAQMKPFTDRGQTVFLVGHGSQPRFNIDEILLDCHRAVRFIRTYASDYSVDPDRLGISGASSGGYLSLAVATTGRTGRAVSPNPAEWASSQVQAAAVFFPPTDLVDYGKPGRTVLEYEPVKFVWHVFDLQGKPREEQIQKLKFISPLSAISKTTPPTLIIHGDNDELVPHEQSERFIARLNELKIPNHLDLRKGAGHGWPGLDKDFALLADWFDKQLAATKKPAENQPAAPSKKSPSQAEEPLKKAS